MNHTGLNLIPTSSEGAPISVHSRKTARASLTVEASLLMVVILFVLFGILYLFFHVHNRAWLTAAAYETAVTAAQAALVSTQEAYASAQWKTAQVQDIGLIGGKNLKAESNIGLLQAKISFRMDTEAVFGGFLWNMNVSAQAPILHPTAWIRQIKAGSEAAFVAAP